MAIFSLSRLARVCQLHQHDNKQLPFAGQPKKMSSSFCRPDELLFRWTPEGKGSFLRAKVSATSFFNDAYFLALRAFFSQGWPYLLLLREPVAPIGFSLVFKADAVGFEVGRFGLMWHWVKWTIPLPTISRRLE